MSFGLMVDVLMKNRLPPPFLSVLDAASLILLFGEISGPSEISFILSKFRNMRAMIVFAGEYYSKIIYQFELCASSHVIKNASDRFPLFFNLGQVLFSKLKTSQ